MSDGGYCVKNVRVVMKGDTNETRTALGLNVNVAVSDVAYLFQMVSRRRIGE